MRKLANALMLFMTLATPVVQAQAEWPNKPIRLVVGAPPGGANDTVARLVAQHMNLGQPVVVDNKNGASSMIAADFVAKAAPDGSVLLLASQTVMAVAPVLQKITSFDPMQDFVGIGLIGTAPLVLVAGPSLPVGNVRDLIALAKSKPGFVDFGNGGVGTSPHMTGVLFAHETGVQLTSVPYPGEQAAMVDIMAGRIHMMFANASSALPHVRGGKLRALAITSLERTKVAPDVPTLSESGVPGFSAATWLGIVAPAATPGTVVNRLNAELNRVLALPEVQEKLTAQGFGMDRMDTARYAKFLRSEHAKWGGLIRDANIRAE